MKYSDLGLLKELKLLAETLEMDSKEFLNEFLIVEFTPEQMDSVSPLVLEKSDVKSILNFIMGKGSKIKSLGRQLQNVMVGRLTTVLAARHRLENSNVDADHKKKMLDTAKAKEETFKDLEDSIRSKMEDVADGDSRLQKIAAVAKSSAAVNANKKKLALLNQVEASENAIARAKEEQRSREERLRKQKEEMDAMIKRAKEKEEEEKKKGGQPEKKEDKKDEKKPEHDSHEDKELSEINDHIDKLQDQLDEINDKLKKPMSQQSAQPLEKKKASLERDIHAQKAEKYQMLAQKAEKKGEKDKAKDYEDKAEEHHNKAKNAKVPK